MKASLLKKLDGILHGVLCGWASKFSQKSLGKPGEILVIRPGGMGDLICADIALNELGLDPRRFIWLVERRSQPWAHYRKLPHLCYDSHPLETLRQVWSRYELVINTEQYFGLAEAYALLAVGSEGHVASFTTNRGSRWSDITVPYDWRIEHETLAFARLFSRALGQFDAEKPRLCRKRLHPPSRPPLVLIAGRQSPSRRLSLKSWSALIDQWRQDDPFLIAAQEQDAEFADQLAGQFTGVAQRFTGSFDELCDEISRSERLLTVDGGALHIGSFFGVPTFSLFTSGRDSKWLPLGEGSLLLRRRDLPCQPCTQFGQVPACPHQYACTRLERATDSVTSGFNRVTSD